MIGRSKEIKVLEKAVSSRMPELLAVIGRRRVGNAYLIRTFGLLPNQHSIGLIDTVIAMDDLF